AEKRVRSEVDRTTTLLSSLGKLKSTVADTQSAARSLSGFSATTTPEQMKAGISQLVSAFNATVESSSSMSTTSGGADEILGSARIGQNLKRAIKNDIALADSLSEWGVKVNANGELTFDTKKFDEQKSKGNDGLGVFQKLGKAIDGVTTARLDDDGVVGRSMNLLNKRADALKVQHASLIDAMQSDTLALMDTSNQTQSNALSTYLSIAKNR
ncbi:MAG TPA: hypothetical protein VM553_20890, partial [Dongiaceae bacterium]|nr:hypothetical protein [Dongiaceae bacterium]